MIVYLPSCPGRLLFREPPRISADLSPTLTPFIFLPNAFRRRQVLSAQVVFLPLCYQAARQPGPPLRLLYAQGFCQSGRRIAYHCAPARHSSSDFSPYRPSIPHSDTFANAIHQISQEFQSSRAHAHTEITQSRPGLPPCVWTITSSAQLGFS